MPFPLVTWPDPRLKQRSLPVEKVDDTVRAELDAMLETMYASNGIGLAAVQVGIMKRMLVADVEQTERGRPGKPMKFVNPEIVRLSDAIQQYDEGCLSFPGQYAEVERPDAVTVRYVDENGELRELQADGLLAICLQHEIDHLNGITFVDHISRIRRDIVLRKLKKEQKAKQAEVP